MKKLFRAAACAMALLAAPCAVALAGDYTASISTYPVSEAATLSPQLPGNVRVERFVISNATSTASAGQVVTVYANCSSTETARAVLSVYVPGASGPVTVEYPFYSSPLALTDACFRKSDAATEVRVNAHYR
ncbi:MAG: hypothetical protein GX410_02470 [Elusimicrobia bacterium]|nr:hypothetical protein [Elusimicrobiota bacterium]